MHCRILEHWDLNVDKNTNMGNRTSCIREINGDKGAVRKII